MIITEEIRAIQLEIGAKLSESLLPAFADQLGTVGPRLAKLVFDVLKGRGFDNLELENVVRGLMQALEPYLLSDDSEHTEHASDYSHEDNSDEEEVAGEDAENGKQSIS